MSDEKQTLTDVSIEVTNGQTIMKFTKVMQEDGEIAVGGTGNTFLYAVGSGTSLGYHRSRKSFDLDL